MNKAAKVVGYIVIGYIALNVVAGGISYGLRANYKRKQATAN